MDGKRLEKSAKAHVVPGRSVITIGRCLIEYTLLIDSARHGEGAWDERPLRPIIWIIMSQNLRYACVSKFSGGYRILRRQSGCNAGEGAPAAEAAEVAQRADRDSKKTAADTETLRQPNHQRRNSNLEAGEPFLNAHGDPQINCTV